MAYKNYCTFKFKKKLLKPHDRGQVKVVCWLIKEEQVRGLKKEACRDALMRQPPLRWATGSLKPVLKNLNLKVSFPPVRRYMDSIRVISLCSSARRLASFTCSGSLGYCLSSLLWLRSLPE
jgi:hypothetical protein